MAEKYSMVYIYVYMCVCVCVCIYLVVPDLGCGI